MQEKPLVECMYGWGQALRLYQDHLEVNGTFYRLNELVAARPLYRRIFGVSSARLELRFRRKVLVLRGIAPIESAEKIIHYLHDRYTSSQDDASEAPIAPETPSNAITAAQPIVYPTNWQASSPSRSVARETDISSYESLQAHAQAPTIPVPVPRLAVPEVSQQGSRGAKRSQRDRLLREHGFDVERVEQLLQADSLPLVSVPVRLLPDEYAHYRTDATLSGEPLVESAGKLGLRGDGGKSRNAPRYRYRVKDQGLLIFTNKRIIYLGRKCQIVLGYARLLHVSRLQGAIAFLAEHWTRREIFEVRYPLECAMYLECILKRFQQPEPFLLHNYALRQGPQVQTEERPYDDIADSETISLSMARWEMSETPVMQSEADSTSVSELEE